MRFLLLLISLNSFAQSTRARFHASNYSTTPLGSSETFTGEWVDCYFFEGMTVAVLADQDGSLFMEQTNDKSTTQSSLPYVITANINEVHSILPTRRYCRVRLVNGATPQTSLDISLITGQSMALISPLNLSIQTDADAQITKSVQIGLNPDDDGYINVPADGYKTAMSTTTPLTNGSSFDSGIIDVSGYQYLQTQIASDQDGQLQGFWYDDAAGTNLIRTFTLPYTAANDLSNTATIVLGKYLRYVYTNNSGSDQDRLYFNTRFSNVPMSGQVLTVDQFIPLNILTTLNRSIIAGLNPSGNYQNVGVNAAGAIESSDFLFEVASNGFENYSIDTKFGNNSDIDTGTGPEDIWAPGGVYTGQPVHSASAETVNVFSSDTDDTSAGTGARTIRISGLDENWEEQTEDITMNGTTAVTSTNQWRRVFRAIVLTAGSQGENDGAITIRHTTTTANVFAIMPEANNQTTIAAYTVPAGKTMYIVRFRASISRANGSAGSAEFTVRTRSEGGVFRGTRREQITTSYPVEYTLKGALKITEKTDIKIRCESVSDNNTAFASAFEYVLIDN